MINKKEAQKHNLKMIEQAKNENLEKLKKLFPELINSDNQLNVEALKDLIDISKTTSNNKGYELTFAGKGIARAKADSETLFELKTQCVQSKNFENTKNTIIRGDNLEVLKILKQNYHEKIKMIYIDPPYNTKSDNFIYQDNFIKNEKDLIENFSLDENTTDFLQNVYSTKSHSGWLSFMYPRLKLARDLLKEQGVIFISIDDNEMANLKIICDEIFGEENFVASLHIEMSATQGMKVNSAQKGEIVKNGEFVLVYCKNNNEKKFVDMLYSKKDWDTHYNIFYDIKTGEKSSLFEHLKNIKKLNLPENFKSKDITEFYRNNKLFREYIHENSNNIYRDAMCDVEIELSNQEQEKLNNGCYVKYKKYLLKKTNTGIIRQLLALNLAIGKTDDFKKDFCLRKIRGDWWQDFYKDMMNINKEGGIIFKNGKKPARLIKDFLKITTQKQDLVLDFFAGSGTTGDAVFQINKEDGGNRKFILVQWDEKIKEKTEAFKFCKENKFEPVISSITIERLNRAGEKIQKEQNGNLDFDNQKLDVGYKVFSLKKKPKIREENELFKLENERKNKKDTLANMLCGTGKFLHADLQELKKDILYLLKEETEEGVEKNLFVLGNIESADLVGFEDANIYMDGYADISLEKFLNLFGMNEKDKERVRVVY